MNINGKQGFTIKLSGKQESVLVHLYYTGTTLPRRTSWRTVEKLKGLGLIVFSTRDLKYMLTQAGADRVRARPRHAEHEHLWVGKANASDPDFVHVPAIFKGVTP